MEFSYAKGLVGQAAESQHAEVFTTSEDDSFIRAEKARAADLATGLLLPIIVDGMSEAVLEFYTTEPVEIDTQLQKVLESVAIQIGRLIERKRHLERIEKEKEFINKAINSLPGLFYMLDEQQNFVRVNQNLIDSMGYSREELEEMHPLDFYLEKDQQRMIEAVQQAFIEGKATLVSQLRTKDGKLPWYYLTGAHFHQEGQDFILGTGIDITDRVQAEQELERHEQLLQSIMDQAGAVIYVKKKDGTFLFVNDEFLKLFGLQKEQVIGKRDVDIIDEDDVQIMRESDLEAIETGKPVELEETVQFKGEKRTYLSNKVPLKNVEGFEECVCGVSTDITERKQAENQLRESLNEKEVLLMEIHHRVKNNLAVVSSMMQLQAYESENEEVTSELNNSQSRIKSMALMHELLYQSKSFSKVNIAENITELLEHISNSIQPKEIETELNLEPVDLNINQAIPCSLILNELLVNIYKHAFPEGQDGKLHIALTENDGNVVLKVRDNGVGLPDDFDLEDPTTVGLRLINVLTKQLEADLTYSSDEEETEFELIFKKMKIKGSASNLVE
ncbi:PAS domain S-box protein [Aliifodinibius sp. S!AR15-10]|uniref:PAS domain S-box protein n=1 Tax=Aliifodinibius sp. S!AR15-10 TaxID=2950437 RepID=UPI002863AC1F|nr:PAS domain S-box protein [Aliifodinibius sp. S!AR15-10]MDR8393625.1 PAS domain S-box protein [Aliifodinibius sp. S!AR15-10]